VTTQQNNENAPMDTVCHKQFRFESLFGKQITTDFDGGYITYDAGGFQSVARPRYG
jgi:hypothetical protein